MQEIKTIKIHEREIPVLISDEREALLAAKAAGRAIIGLWRKEQEMDEISAADYVVEDLEDVTEEYLERVARRYLGLPWNICETERLLIRELFADDFDLLWEHQVGHGLGSADELEAYTKHQYSFYEFGIWALIEKKTGNLVGVAGLKVPEEQIFERSEDHIELFEWKETEENSTVETEPLELGYHIFLNDRRKGYAKEACKEILRYGRETLGISVFWAQIEKENTASKYLAEALGFRVIKRK